MSEQTDPEFLRREAYRNASDLDTRNRIQAEFRSNPLSWHDWLFAHLRLPEDGRLLELGCGGGTLWAGRQGAIPPGCRVVLSDFSPSMAAAARDELGGRFNYAVLDVQSIPFKESEFQAVLGIGLLDHVPDREKALAEVRRVLEPGGRLYVTAGGRGHLKEIDALVRPFLPKARYGGDPDRFGIENGEGLLAPWFGHVENFNFKDRLVFKTAGPVLEYILSEASVRRGLQGKKRAAFVWYLKEKLGEAGEILVTTEKGLFIAR